MIDRKPIKQLNFEEQKARKLKRQEKAERLGLGKPKPIKSKKPKKPSVAKLKKKADQAFSKYIRYRDGKKVNDEWFTRCFTCGEWKPFKSMQAGHFVRRSVNQLRYSELNVHGQDYLCNVLRYGEQYLYAIELDKTYGQGTAQSLQNQRFDTHKLTVDELMNIIETANKKVKEYQDGRQ